MTHRFLAVLYFVPIVAARCLVDAGIAMKKAALDEWRGFKRTF